MNDLHQIRLSRHHCINRLVRCRSFVDHILVLPAFHAFGVLYRETHVLLDELADAVAESTRKDYIEMVSTVPLLILKDFGMRKLPHTAAEDLLEIVMRRYERCRSCLHRIGLWKIGANCSAMSRQSAPCSIDCCIMVMCLSEVREAGALKRHLGRTMIAGRQLDTRRHQSGKDVASSPQQPLLRYFDLE